MHFLNFKRFFTNVWSRSFILSLFTIFIFIIYESKQEVDYIHDKDFYHPIEHGLRGGISDVHRSRYSNSNAARILTHDDVQKFNGLPMTPNLANAKNSSIKTQL